MLWHDTARRAWSRLGLDLIVEFGASPVLAPMFKRIDGAPKAMTVSDAAGVEKLRAQLADAARSARRRMTGKVAVVTGASRGIGRAIAVDLVRAGADVALFGRDTLALAETESACREAREGAKVSMHVVDVAAEDDVNDAIAAVLTEYGRVDVAVANAGQSKDGLILRFKQRRPRPAHRRQPQVRVLPERRRRQADDEAALGRDRVRVVDRRDCG